MIPDDLLGFTEQKRAWFSFFLNLTSIQFFRSEHFSHHRALLTALLVPQEKDLAFSLKCHYVEQMSMFLIRAFILLQQSSRLAFL